MGSTNNRNSVLSHNHNINNELSSANGLTLNHIHVGLNQNPGLKGNSHTSLKSPKSINQAKKGGPILRPSELLDSNEKLRNNVDS